MTRVTSNSRLNNEIISIIVSIVSKLWHFAITNTFESKTFAQCKKFVLLDFNVTMYGDDSIIFTIIQIWYNIRIWTIILWIRNDVGFHTKLPDNHLQNENSTNLWKKVSFFALLNSKMLAESKWVWLFIPKINQDNQNLHHSVRCTTHWMKKSKEFVV